MANIATFFKAIEHGKVRTVSQMLESGFDINCRNSQDQSVLMQAVYIKKDDMRTYIVRLLLTRGCQVNAQDNKGHSALMLASFEKNRDDVVRRLIALDTCDPNLQDRQGDTALIYAVYGCNPSVIRILVNDTHTKHIIDVNRKNNDGINPLKIALKLGYAECCRVLLEEGGADVGVIKKRNSLAKLLAKDGTQPAASSVKHKKKKPTKKQEKVPGTFGLEEDVSHRAYFGDNEDGDSDTLFSRKTRRKRKRGKGKDTSDELHKEVVEPLDFNRPPVLNANSFYKSESEVWSPPCDQRHLFSSVSTRQSYNGTISPSSSEQDSSRRRHSYRTDTGRSSNALRLTPLSLDTPKGNQPMGKIKKEPILPAIPTGVSRINLINSPHNFSK